MDRKDVLKRLLYPKCKSAIEFQFDSLRANPLLSYITIEDIVQLNKIATSIKYSSKQKDKYVMIDRILTARGFKKMASGTNRVTYRFLNDYSIVLKVAIDKVGLSDNGNEYRNQFLLKPFVTKCFEVSPCGTVGLFERVVPITSREEFENIADDIFDLINNLIGKYVLEDIGEKFYMNYGLRDGFGPVLLDYPYVFELDGRKLICNVVDPLEPLGYCGGEIDYDLGYNDLVCKKCGKRYLATELKSEEKTDKPKIIIKGEDIIMKCVLKRGDEVISKLNSEQPVSVDTIPSRNKYDKMKGKLTRGEQEKNKKSYKPSIKTSDDVGFKCRLKGHPKGKNIDIEAIKQDQRLERNTTKIPVSFNEEEVIENIDIKNTLNAHIVREETTEPKVDIKTESIQPQVEPNKEKVFEGEPDSDNYEKPNREYFRAEFKGNEIWDIDSNELVGYTYPYVEADYNEDNCKSDSVAGYSENDNLYSSEDDFDNEYDDSYEESDEEIEHEDTSFGVNIGELIGDKFKTFGQNENYKTEKIVSPVPNHFAAKPSVPEVTINPREKKPEIKPEELNKLDNF